MSRTYTLDTKAATQADNIVSRIDQTGKYVGTLTRVEIVTSKNETEGVEFSFKADDGATADFLSLWTYNAKGEALPSLKTLNAMMTVARVKSLTPTAGQVEKWDSGSGQRGKFAATIFPELTNKRIGLLLQREEYEKRDGSTGAKVNIVGCFDPDSELTASEILARKTEPETLARMAAALRDKPMKSKAATASTPMAPAGFGDDDMDIPF
ncbi:MAG: hypothetical protein NUV51_06605 [Sulfuricaulis sp.]|nr:hypothetical protein [Sulfuricaulis sp.]